MQNLDIKKFNLRIQTKKNVAVASFENISIIASMPLTHQLPIVYTKAPYLESLFTPPFVLAKYIWASRLVEKYFPGYCYTVQFSKTKTVIFHVKLAHLIPFISFLKNSLWFNATLFDLFANDFSSRINRFEITYCLLSAKTNERIYIRLFVDEKTVVPSVTGLFAAANWLEREIWDMYGVPFGGHPDLRRLLTDYGFTGFPLRKDFPLTGFFEYRYNDTKRLVVLETINLLQEFRLYFFTSTWIPVNKY